MGGNSIQIQKNIEVLENPLVGEKVAVLVDSEYITEEINMYDTFFTEKYGAVVDFMTNLGGESSRKIHSDLVDPDTQKQSHFTVTKDIASCNPNDYAIVITAANYVACRLREVPPTGCLGDASMVRTPVAVRFMASAMMNPYIVKGALCHALWILTPVPELLKGRKVVCHTVVLADVLNAGAIYEPDGKHVVVDRDLVTGRSAEDRYEFLDNLYHTYVSIYQDRQTLEETLKKEQKDRNLTIEHRKIEEKELEQKLANKRKERPLCMPIDQI